MALPVKYVPWGIANRFDDHIELNEHLPEYPELHDAILKHELQHTDAKGFSSKDFILDIGPSKVNYLKMIKFMCFYPKSFLQFAPAYKQGKTIYYDINMCIVWFFMISLMSISLFIAVH